MEWILEKLTDRLEKIEDDLSEIKVIMARNTASLEEHMRRTKTAEDQLDMLKRELLPIQDHIRKVQVIFLITSSLGSTILVIGTLLRIFHVI